MFIGTPVFLGNGRLWLHGRSLPDEIARRDSACQVSLVQLIDDDVGRLRGPGHGGAVQAEADGLQVAVGVLQALAEVGHHNAEALAWKERD